jgi:predicted aminopeptidase
MKQSALKQFREQYAQLRASWVGDPARFRGFDLWVERANNASFGAQAAYDELVPGFEALFVREQRDWKRFYDAVKRLAALPRGERHELLKQTP